MLLLLLDQLLNRAVLPVGALLASWVVQFPANFLTHFFLVDNSLGQIVHALLAHLLQDFLNGTARRSQLVPVVNLEANHLYLHALHYASRGIDWQFLNGFQNSNRCLYSCYAEVP